MPRILNNGAEIDWRREPEAPDDQNTGIGGDTWTDLKVGVGGLVQGGAAIGDLFTRPVRDEDDPTFSERLAKADENTVGSEKWMQAKRREYSPVRQEQEAEYQRRLDAADSEWGKAGVTASEFAMNPRLALGRLAQSVPSVALTAVPGGLAGAVARKAALSTARVAGSAMGASAATEGVISGAQNAYDTINYNVENNKPRYENLGNAAITAVGVGATSLLMNKFGGGVEAALFNKEARDTLRMGAQEAAAREGKSFWHSPRMAQAGRGMLAEGTEEAAQAPWETIPQNLATDKEWSEGLGQGVAEGAIVGGGLGGAVRFAVRPEKKEETKGNEPPQTLMLPPPQPKAPQPGGPQGNPVVDEAVAKTPLVPQQAAHSAAEPAQAEEPKQPSYQRQFMDTFGADFLPPVYVTPKSVRQFEAIKVAPYGKELVDLHVAARRETGVPGTSNSIMKDVENDLQLVDGASPEAARASLIQRYRGLANQYAKGEAALAKHDMYAALAEKLEKPETSISQFIAQQRAQRVAEALAVAEAKAAQAAQTETQEAPVAVAENAVPVENPSPAEPGKAAPTPQAEAVKEKPAPKAATVEEKPAPVEEVTPTVVPTKLQEEQSFMNFSAGYAERFAAAGVIRKGRKKFTRSDINPEKVKKVSDPSVVDLLEEFQREANARFGRGYVRLPIPTREEAQRRADVEPYAKVQREARAVKKKANAAAEAIKSGKRDTMPEEDRAAFSGYLVNHPRIAKKYSAKAGFPTAKGESMLAHAGEYLMRPKNRAEREELMKEARKEVAKRKAERLGKPTVKEDKKEAAKLDKASRSAEVKEILDESSDLETQNIDVRVALNQGVPESAAGGIEDSVDKEYEARSATSLGEDSDTLSIGEQLAKGFADKAVGMLEARLQAYKHAEGVLEDQGGIFKRIAEAEEEMLKKEEFKELLGLDKEARNKAVMDRSTPFLLGYTEMLDKMYPNKHVGGAIRGSGGTYKLPLFTAISEKLAPKVRYKLGAAKKTPLQEALDKIISGAVPPLPGVIKRYVDKYLNGDPGWFTFTTFDELQKDLRSRKRSKEADAIFQRAVYAEGTNFEGVGLPLRDVAGNAENLEADLATVFTPQTAKAVANGVETFNRLGFQLPDVWVIDGTRQENPSMAAMRSVGLGDVYMGFRSVEDLSVQSLAKDDADYISDTGVVWLAPNDKAAKSPETASTTMLATHEFVHGWDSEHIGKNGIYPSEKLLAEVFSKAPEDFSVFKDLTYLCKEGGTAQPDASRSSRIYNELTAAEKTFFGELFYPFKAENTMGEAEAPGRVLASEFLADWVSKVYSSDYGRETFRRHFPELYNVFENFVKSARDFDPEGAKNDIRRGGPSENVERRVSDNNKTDRRFSTGTRPSGENGSSTEGRASANGEGLSAAGEGGLDQTEKARRRRTPEEVEADRQAKREARVASKLADMKLSAEMAQAADYAPDTFSTDRWKELATNVVEAELDVAISRGAMNGIKDKSSTNRHYVAAKNINDANELALAKARMAYQQYLQDHKVEPPPAVMKQVADYQFPFDKWIQGHTSGGLRDFLLKLNANTFKHSLNFLFTRDLVNLVKDKLPAISEWYSRNLARAELSRKYMDEVVAFGQRTAKFDDATYKRVNQFMERAVLEGVWGYVPDDVAKKLSKEELAKNTAFKAELSTLPKEAREFFREALRHGQEMRKDIRRYVLENARRNFDRLIANATPERAEQLKKELELQETRINEALADSVKPYFPLRRFGDYVVVMRSRDYVQAMQQFTKMREALRKKDNPTAAEKEALGDAKAKLRSMQSNGVDYIVEFAEDRSAALKRRDELRQEFPDGVPETFTRMEFFKDGLPDLSQLERVAQRAASAEKETTLDNVDDKLYVEFSKLANLMWIQALSDDSALKSRLHRRKVTGYSEDMIRSFLETGKVEANYIGYLRHGAEIRQAIDDMKEQTRTSDNRDVATTVLNEVIRRVDDELTGQSKITNAMLRTTSVWMLLTSPAFYLQNLTQPYMLSVPYLSGKFGMYKPLSLMSKNMLRVAKWVKDDPTLSFLDKLEKSNQITAAERKALQTLKEQGLLDMGLSQEFGTILERKGSGWINKMLGYTNMLSSAARRVELVNRVATALTTFKLESGRLKAKGLKADAVQINATEYANKVLYETHGDYSSFNSPRAFKAGMFMRLATQFRKFQLIQIGLFYRMILAGYMNDKNTESAKEKQRWARLGLNWTLGMHLLMTGVKGMPIVGTIAALAGSALGDVGDDDDDYWTKVFGNDEAGKALYRGLPTLLGVDVSEKIGAGTMLSPLPFYDGSMTFKNGEEDVKQLIVQLLGPTASLALKFGRMSPYFQQGDYGKMLEQGAPTGLSNFLKAMRFSSEGITTKAGDVMIPGEKLTLGDIISQGIGLPSNTISGRNRLVASGYRHEEEYKRLKSVLAYQWREAVKSGSAAERKTVVLQLNKINRSRKAQGFKPWTIKELSQTLKAQIRREHSVVNGVAATRSNRGFYERYGSE